MNRQFQTETLPKKGMPAIDWVSKPIWAANINAALIEAKRHIDASLVAS